MIPERIGLFPEKIADFFYRKSIFLPFSISSRIRPYPVSVRKFPHTAIGFQIRMYFSGEISVSFPHRSITNPLFPRRTAGKKVSDELVSGIKESCLYLIYLMLIAGLHSDFNDTAVNGGVRLSPVMVDTHHISAPCRNNLRDAL